MRKVISPPAVAAAFAAALWVPALQAETALMIKAGSFTLDEQEQAIDAVPLAFEDGSSGFGGELEWRMESGVGLGIEVLMYDVEHEAFGLNGSMDVVAVLFNAKKYFSPTKTVHPYIGAGIGSAATDFSGDLIDGNSAGLALQAVAGVEFRFDRVGFYTEAKFLSADTEDEAEENADASGSGVFAGLTILF